MDRNPPNRWVLVVFGLFFLTVAPPEACTSKHLRSVVVPCEPAKIFSEPLSAANLCVLRILDLSSRDAGFWADSQPSGRLFSGFCECPGEGGGSILAKGFSH